MMRTVMKRISVIALVLLMAAAPITSMAGAEEVQEDIDALLKTTEQNEDIEMVEELSSAATTWQRGIEIIDADSDGNPESVIAAETGETAEGANWTRVVEYKDTDSDGTPDRLVAYEIAEDALRKYVAGAEYVDADSDGNPETFQAVQAYDESATRWAKRYINYEDADSDGIPELVEAFSVGRYDRLAWRAAAKMVDADSDGNPESFEAYQEVKLAWNKWARRYLGYTDADSDGNPETVKYFEEGRWNRFHVIGYAHLEDANSDGNPELVEATRTANLGLVAVAIEGVKYVDTDSDGHPELIEYFALVATDDGAAVRGLEYNDADSDGNPETLKAYEGLKVDDELVASRGLEVTDANSDGSPEKVVIIAWAVSTDGKLVEGAEWNDANGDGNPESIKAYRHLETTSGLNVSQAFEYVDADSDGNPEKVTYYEIGKIAIQDDGIVAITESAGEGLPPMEELSDVEAPSTEDMQLPEDVGDLSPMGTLLEPWSGTDMRPWETEDGAAALMP